MNAKSLNNFINCKRDYKKILIGFVTIYTLFFFSIILLRYVGFGIGDVRNFSQFLWNTSNGDWFISTGNYPFAADTHRLGVHFSLLAAIVISPIYFFAPYPEILLGIHVFAMSITALPVFAACCILLSDERKAFLWAIIYLLNPITVYSTIFGFQDHSLATPILATAIWAIVAKRLDVMIICSICLILAKEHFGITVAGLGVLWGYYHKEWEVKLGMIILGFSSFAIILLLIMPHYNSYGSHHMLSAEMPATHSRYIWMKGSFQESLESFYEIITSKMNTVYYTWILVPFLFFPIMAFIFISPAIADLAAIILSNNVIPKTITYYHSSCVIPVFTIAACMGGKNINNFLSSVNPRLNKIWEHIALKSIVLILIINVLLFGHIMNAIIPSIKLLASEDMDWSYGAKFQKVKEFLGADKKIRASLGVGSHLSQRKYIAPMSAWNNESDTIVLRLDWKIFVVLGEPFINIKTKTLNYFLNSADWSITYWDNPWIVFEKWQENSVSNVDFLKDFDQIMKKYKEAKGKNKIFTIEVYN